MRRKNPLEEIILGKVADLAVSHYTKKKTKKKKNPAAFGSFIPIRVVGNKVQIKVPNRNPGTLAQAKAIAKKLGVRRNPEKSKYGIRTKGLPKPSNFKITKRFMGNVWMRTLSDTLAAKLITKLRTEGYSVWFETPDRDPEIPRGMWNVYVEKD